MFSIKSSLNYSKMFVSFSIVFLVWNLGHIWPGGGGTGSSLFLLTEASPTRASVCEVEAAFHLKTVTPIWESEALSISGCYSQHATDRSQEVHVLHLKESIGMTPPHVVTVHLRPMTDRTVHAGPLVIVLYSEFSVNWRLVGHRLTNDTLHRIHVTKGSQVIESKNLNVNIYRRDSGRVKNILSWVQKRYKALTSYAKIEGANNVYLKVGIGGDAPEKCVIKKRGSVGNVDAFFSEPIPISQRQGCVADGVTGTTDRVVHVVKIHELYDGFESAERSHRVVVDLRSRDGRPITREVALVLQAPNPVVWVLQSESVWGRLDVVTDGKLEFPHSAPSQRVKVRTETLPGSNKELLSYSLDLFGPSFAFTEVWKANRLEIVVDEDGEKIPSEKEPRSTTDDLENEEDSSSVGLGANKHVVKAHLNRGIVDSRLDTQVLVKSSAPPKGNKDIIRLPNVMLMDAMTVECLPQHMRVSFPRLALEQLGLQSTDISLIDSYCSVAVNDTHYVLSSPFHYCGTKRELDNDKIIYKNEVVFHFHMKTISESVVGRSSTSSDEVPIDDEDSDVGSGAGEIVSPTNESRTGSTTEPRSLQFQCEYIGSGDINIREEVPSVSSQSQRDVTTLTATRDLFKMELYRDPSYIRNVRPTEYPFVAFEHDTLYVETQLDAGETLRVVTEDCWLSESEDPMADVAVHLIRNICPAGLTVKFESSGDDSNNRFSFQLASDYISHSVLYVHCKLAICTTEQTHSSRWNLKMCIDPHDFCVKDTLKSYLERSRGTHPTTFTKGPFQVRRRSPNTSSSSSSSSRIPFQSGAPLRSQGKLDLEVVGGVGETIDVRCSIPEQQSIIILGLSTEAVIGIAFASFIIGVCLSAILWCIYLKTDPLRRSPHRRVTHNSGYDLSGHSGSSTPSSQSPMTA